MLQDSGKNIVGFTWGIEGWGVGWGREMETGELRKTP